MTERKLVKQGRNALTLTLPAKWLKERGLHAGDGLRVSEQGENLLIHGTRARESCDTTIDLRGLEHNSAWHLLMGAYIEGRDRIEVLHDNPASVQRVASRLTGFVIHEHSPTRSVLQTIVAVPEDDVDRMLRRAGHLFVQHATTVVALARGERSLEDVKADEHLLDDALLYCMRSLVKYRHERQQELFLLCAWIEMAADMLSIIATHLGRDVALAERARSAVDAYVSGIFSNDYKKLYTSLRAFRSGLGKDRFVDGVAFAFADMLYNNIGSFVVDPKHQNI